MCIVVAISPADSLFFKFLTWLFSPEPSLWVIGIGIGVGFTVALAPTLRNIRLAHLFFGLAWVWTYGCILEEIMFIKLPLRYSIPVTFLIAGLVGVMALLCHYWVEKNHEEQTTQTEKSPEAFPDKKNTSPTPTTIPNKPTDIVPNRKRTKKDPAVKKSSSAAINIAPGGFAISGGTVVNPVVNNSVPQRRIGENKRKDIIRLLSQHPARIAVYSVQGDKEALTYAKQWVSILQEAGWKVDGNGVGAFIGDIPFAGVVVEVYGQPTRLGESFNIEKNTPEAVLYQSLSLNGDPVGGHRDFSSTNEGTITLRIGFQPEN
jgi:hypothetical protein